MSIGLEKERIPGGIRRRGVFGDFQNQAKKESL